MGNMSGMWEAIIMSLLFVVLLSTVLAGLNAKYDKDYSIGLDTSGLDAFADTTQTAYDETGGEVEQTDAGLSLKSSWTMAKGILTTLWSFVNGSWIGNLIINVLNITGTAGATIALVLRMLFLALLLFAIIRLFFKVIP